MKQILLAVSGGAPSKKAFRYAVDLSKRIRAELSILRFMEKGRLAQHFLVSRHKLSRLGQFLEDAFAQVAFAEEGVQTGPGTPAQKQPDPFAQMLTNDADGPPTDVVLENDDPDADLRRFVDSHHDVVLTILDSAKDTTSPGENRARFRKLKKKLGVPLVIVKPDKV